MITCEPSTLVIWALARWAMERTTSAPAALSPVATTAREGSFFHAGGPVGSSKAPAATGRWAAHSTAALFPEGRWRRRHGDDAGDVSHRKLRPSRRGEAGVAK